MIAMYVFICVHSNPYYFASCSPRPSVSGTMTDVGTHALLKNGMQRSRAWCGTPPILGVVNMVGTRNFTCYMGAL